MYEQAKRGINLLHIAKDHPLTAGIILSGLISEQLPYVYPEADVAKFIGVEPDKLADWRRKGLVTPDEHTISAHHIVRFYNPQQILRAACIKGLRGDGWEFADVKYELTRPGWLEDNIDLIQRVIDTKNNQAEEER